MELSTRIDQAIENGADTDVTELVRDVILQEDARGAYRLAKHFQNVNVRALQDVVTKSKRVAYVYWFARFVKGAAIKPLHAAMVNSGHLNYNYHFVKFMKGESVNAQANKHYDFAMEILP